MRGSSAPGACVGGLVQAILLLLLLMCALQYPFAMVGRKPARDE